MNTELCRQALEKVENPNVLVNIISRRVRQLNSGGGVGSRPLVADYATMGVADIALAELVEDKMGYELLSLPEKSGPAKRKKPKKK
jgi:DNA-directed RNA polymerase subunit omega